MKTAAIVNCFTCSLSSTLSTLSYNIYYGWFINNFFSNNERITQVHVTKEYLQLEPIGLVFVFFFALILVIQFTAMLFHRFGTFAHILASTSLDWYCCKKVSVFGNC